MSSSHNLTINYNHHTNGLLLSIIVDLVASIGIVVNIICFFFTLRGNKVKNKKQKLLLTTLTLNNAVALIGLLCAQLWTNLSQSESKSRYFCGIYVLNRMFGVNGGCTDVVMAIDRFFAVRKPILYSHRITTFMVRSFLCTILLLASLFTLAPLMGLGSYYDTEKEKCLTYRNSANVFDYSYAIAFVIFGFAICIILVLCNIGVVTSLCNRKSFVHIAPSPYKKFMELDEKQEVAFSKLMVAISMLYILCWLPQMIISALYLTLENISSNSLTRCSNFASLLLLLNFVLNPIVQIFMLK